jgi:transposase
MACYRDSFTFTLLKGTFQHDLAPCHNSKAVKKFVQENEINMLDWPGNSSDMNPIENLWSIVKKRLGEKYSQETSG